MPKKAIKDVEETSSETKKTKATSKTVKAATTKKTTTTKKATTPKKESASAKKTATKKTTTAKKETATKKATATKKTSTAAKKEPAVKKTTAAKKEPLAKKTTAAKKTSTVAKKESVVKKTTAAKKTSTVAKKEPVAKKTTAAKKTSTAAKKEPVAKKTTATKKEPVAKKTTAAKKTSTVAKKASTVKKAAEPKEEIKKKATKAKSTTKKTATKKTTTAKKTTSKKVTTKKENALEKYANVLEYYDLPYRYNETVVKILAQTPKVLFVYWDISDADRTAYVDRYGEFFFNDTYPILLVHNKTLNYTDEIEINDFANSWYISIPDSRCEYTVELARRFKEYVQRNPEQPHKEEIHNIISVAASNDITMPNDHVLLNELKPQVKYRNVKTGKESYKNIKHILADKKLVDFYNLYQKIYQVEDLRGLFDLNNPSSGNPTSTFK